MNGMKKSPKKTPHQKNEQLEKPPLEYYLNLKYPVTVYPEPEGGYVAQIKDLPGCLTQGETPDEVLSNIEEARELWIETAYEFGDDIPLPNTGKEYSGKVLLRMPRSLHRQLVESAEREGVSFNQYVISLLSERNALRDTENINNQLERIYKVLSEQTITLTEQQMEAFKQLVTVNSAI